MRASLARLTAVLLVLPLAATDANAQSTLWIDPDPAVGMDVPAGGGQANPFLTIGFGVSQAASLPLVLNLNRIPAPTRRAPTARASPSRSRRR